MSAKIVSARRLALVLSVILPASLSCGSRALDGGAQASPLDGGVERRAVDFIESGRCGDGILDPGESCDDANTISNDGCTVLCQVEDRAVCPVPGQPCLLFPPTCGNGILDPGEACDDGNQREGDGCAVDCTVIEAGWTCPAAGRRCFHATFCGNGQVSGPETCDDGNLSDGDGCSSTCLVEPGCFCTSTGCPCSPCVDGVSASGAACDVPHCGDGVISGAEQCDDGAGNGKANGVEYGACTVRCTLETYCGDGVVSGREECDLGAMNGGNYGAPGCTRSCTRPRYCGDGFVDADLGEACDFGPNNGVPGVPCTAACQIVII